ncbi:MFS transporter [Sulfobacillus thermosulfidooxidans]|uniref:MFS transporter n=1 Tax=Sulfobacillus thermosulfidooxidans TaxID=28034 RepID=UPI0002D7908E|nr:MFS transporter [Sulfobacillus thermosulfidooxidans]
MSQHPRLLWPYATFAFAVGLGWFVLAPLVPNIINQFHGSLSSVLLLISLYGYTMIIGSLPAGLWIAKKGPQPVLRWAIILTVVGLFLRAMASAYPILLIAQIIAALAYPFLIAPIGSILRLSGILRTKMATGLVIGCLFLGMAVSSILGPHLSLRTDFWLTAVVSLVVGIWLWMSSRVIVAEAPLILGRIRIVVSRWWLIGFVISSISVMYGSISTTALFHWHVPNALDLGGVLSSLTFLGSAFGAIGFGWLAEQKNNSTGLQRILAILSFGFLLACALELTGLLTPEASALDFAFLGFGIVGNGWYTLALERAARQAQNAGSAGLATAGYSMASNIGVAVIPVVLGPLVTQRPLWWLGLVVLMALIAMVVPFVTKQDDPSLMAHRTA